MPELEFINAKSTHRLDNADRKRLRRHVLKARREQTPSKSWVNPGLSRLPDVGPMTGLVLPTKTIPRSFSSGMSTIQFPCEITPRIVRELHNFMILRKTGLSPFEACAQVHASDEQLFAGVVADPLMVYLSLFQARIYFGRKFELNRSDAETYYFLCQVLRLLQQRLNGDRAVSDTTFLVVASLIMIEHDSGDEDAARRHMAGLYRMVQLRGGVKALTHNDYRMQRKVCRVDLSVALKFDTQPLFFRQDMAWQSFLARSNLIRRRRRNNGTSDSLAHLNVCDKLKNVWKDLAEFSLVAELAYQTTRTLDPSLVNEAMISIMYRLLHLSYSPCSVDEILRLGLLIYSTHVFLPGQTFMGRYRHLVDRLRMAFVDDMKVLGSLTSGLRLWLIIAAIMLDVPAACDYTFTDIIDSAVEAEGLKSWKDARVMLKSVMWISFIHDEPGKAIVDSSLARSVVKTAAVV